MTEHEEFLADIKAEIHPLIENPAFLRHVRDFEKKIPPDEEPRPHDADWPALDPEPTALDLLLPPLLDQCLWNGDTAPAITTDDKALQMAAKCFLLAVLHDLQPAPCETPIHETKPYQIG